MKKVKISTLLKHKHRLTNDLVLERVEELQDGYIISKIDDCLLKRDLTQRDLSILTGIRIGTISDMVNGKESGFNKTRLVAVMSALRVSKLSDLIDIRLPEDIAAQYEAESLRWITTGEMPEGHKEIYKHNLLKGSGLD